MDDVAEKRRDGKVLAAITLVALVLRIVAIRFLYTNTWNNFDNHLLFGFEVGRIARSLATGHGYGNPMLVETGPTAWITPVYPCLLAGVFKIFGIYSKASAFVILGFNSLFSAFTCIPLFFIARRNFGRTVAITACCLWAVWPYSIYIASSFVWETCLSALFLAILFLWTLRLKEQPGRWAWLRPALGVRGADERLDPFRFPFSRRLGALSPVASVAKPVAQVRRACSARPCDCPPALAGSQLPRVSCADLSARHFLGRVLGRQ